MVQEFATEVLNDDVDLSLPWKLHIICVHLPQFLERHQTGLSKYAEQCGEAVHADFKKTQRRFNVRESHPEHGKRLRNGIVDYSSRRL